jgi:hypothetical protein
MMLTERIRSAPASMAADLGSGAANPVGLHRLLRDEASQGTRVPLLQWLDRWLRGPRPHLSHAPPRPPCHAAADLQGPVAAI